jgi:hypothetical protein
MRIIALLSFYDEPVEDLVSCIHGLANAGVDELVALDGAYALYPEGQAASNPNQHAAITLACRQLGIASTVRAPSGVWAGNEVEKRTALFALGWAVAEPGDWFFVMDADQVVTGIPADFRERLEHTERETAEVEFLDIPALEANQPDWPARFSVRNLFRAQPIHLERNHITYVTDDGRLLWGWDGDERPLEPFLSLKEVVVEHRPHHRPRDRQQAKMQYYTARDTQKIERGQCRHCSRPSDRLVAVGWRLTEIGPVADWEECCVFHAEQMERRGKNRLKRLGIDPKSIRIENRNGRAPEPLALEASNA